MHIHMQETRCMPGASLVRVTANTIFKGTLEVSYGNLDQSAKLNVHQSVLFVKVPNLMAEGMAYLFIN